MKLKKILTSIIALLFLYSCADYKTPTKKDEKIYFSSSGFALIYENELYDNKIINKKINNDELYVVHNFLKRNTIIKITNPNNSKILLTKVNKNFKYPNFFNILISKKVADTLELNEEDPYVEILEVKKNKTFVAKKSNTFDEERNVAGKAPVEEIKVDDLSVKKNKKKKNKLKNHSYLIVIGDFYYYESAVKLKNELFKKVNSDKFFIKKINENSHRLALGPFKNFKALKTTYISLNNLGFENLNIYKE